ncbi:hypothetical protein Tco_1376647 [Tanacetum coccineum]
MQYRIGFNFVQNIGNGNVVAAGLRSDHRRRLLLIFRLVVDCSIGRKKQGIQNQAEECDLMGCLQRS